MSLCEKQGGTQGVHKMLRALVGQDRATRSPPKLPTPLKSPKEFPKAPKHVTCPVLRACWDLAI